MAKTSVDMTRGDIGAHLVRFALPLLAGQLFQQLYNTVDSVVVGRYVGKQALAAVGSTGMVINALIGFFTGLASGGSVIISQYFGAHDDEGLQHAVHTSVFIALVMSLLCTGLGMAFTEPMLRWMSTPDDVFSDAVTYLRIYFAGVSGVLIYSIGSGILQAVGDARHPLYFLIFSALLNVAGDLLFVCVFHMGIAGVAYATILSQFLSAILVVYTLCRASGSCRLHLSRLRPHGHVLGSILRIGLPTAFQTGITSVSNVFVQGYINAFQSDCMAGWTVYNRLDSFIWLPMLCIGMASSTFVGQNLGAGQIERSKKGVRIALVIALSFTALIVAPLMIFARPLLSLFNDDAEVLRYGVMFVTAISPFYIPYCFTQIYSGALRGAGDSLSSMLICLGSFVAFRQVYLFIGTKFITNPLFVGMGYPAGWVLSIILFIVVYKSGRWERNVRMVREP